MSSIKRTLELNSDETNELISVLAASKVKHQTDIDLLKKALDKALDKEIAPHPLLQWSITYSNERLAVIDSLIQQVINGSAELKVSE
ncbi:hypothetical protein [Pseudoalteromonas neustonica]|uniref:hypothetical protein n=1 Tax=Pseudoalteromonas neustonica TaxID=1840331 RepID=UPI0007DB45B4|nr:hypothetical protein [Pseudoalteromonas neustonica]